MLELIYTATPKGLIQGRSGFSTVAMTQGFPPNLIPAIENMSGFRNLFMPGDPHAADNPVNCTYQQLRFGSTTLLLVSQIEYAGLSYTGRSNTLAHHYVFNVDDPFLQTHAPVFLLQMAENFPAWQGEPRLLAEKAALPAANAPHDCATWEKLTGSADWGKIVAEMVKRQMPSGVVLQFAPLQYGKAELLALIAEVSAQLTPQENARFTFSTYCYQSTIGNPLFLRAYPENSSLLSSIKWMNQETILTLGQKNDIPEKYQTLLQPHRETPPNTINLAENAIPETSPSVSPQVVLSSPPPPRTKGSSLAPVAAPVARGAETYIAASPSPAWRKWLIAAIALILLASLGGLFLLINARTPKSQSTASTQVASQTASAPLQDAVVKEETPVAVAPPPPAQKTEKSIPPVEKKQTSKKAVVAAPQISDAEWFDFYLALHDQKDVIPIPNALQSAQIVRVELKEAQASKSAITTKFFAENGKITIYEIKAGGRDPMNPVNEPDLDHVLMMLSSNSKALIVNAKSGMDAAEKIKTIVFAVGDAEIPFQNEFQESYWKFALQQIKIDKEVKGGKLWLTVKHPESPFLTEKCRESLQLKITCDGKDAFYGFDKKEIPLPQFDALSFFQEKQKKFLAARKKYEDAPVPQQPRLFTGELPQILQKKIPEEALDPVLKKYNVKWNELYENVNQLQDLQKSINTLIFKNQNLFKDPRWEKVKEMVDNCFQAYPKELKTYQDALESRQLLHQAMNKAEKDLNDALEDLKKYLWAGEVLKENLKKDDDALRKALREKYQNEIQVTPVRKSEK